MSGGGIRPRAPAVERSPFGTLADGRVVDLFTISNGRLTLSAITYGGIITSLHVPGRDGRLANVVLGFDRLEPYVENRSYIGALIGRCANRIDAGHVSIDGVVHWLQTNDGPNHLHGGYHGFSRKLWSAAPLLSDDSAGMALTRTSPAGEDGYPGAVQVEARYLLTTEDTVVLEYVATTDAPTIINLTQHSYFNLAGTASASVLDHELTMIAECYTPVRPDLIPTGTLESVAGTPFDFRRPARLRERLHEQHPQLQAAGGFDHNFVLATAMGELAPAASLRDPASGRRLHIRTTEPGLQFYSGHLLDRTAASDGSLFGKHAGLCLESQHFPDAPNQTAFPSVVIRPGAEYRSMTTWHFDVS